jgi:hypothetical protein
MSSVALGGKKDKFHDTGVHKAIVVGLSGLLFTTLLLGRCSNKVSKLFRTSFTVVCRAQFPSLCLSLWLGGVSTMLVQAWDL